MHKIILSLIELSELLGQMRVIIKEEVAAGLSNSSDTGKREKPITTKELCDYLSITEPTVIRWKAKGKIPYFNIGTAVRFNLQDVLKSLGK